MSNPRKFNDCPLGTRFKYGEDRSTIWVIIDHYGNAGDGLVAKWEGVDSPSTTQMVCSFAENSIQRLLIDIYVVE